jgi:multidrug transporter EmrE-like cation transporter
VAIYIVVLYCVLYALLNVAGATLIKKAVSGAALASAMDYVHVLLRLKSIIGFGLVFVSALVLMKALSQTSLTLMVPLSTGINFLITLAAGYFFLNEQISGLTLAGIVLVLGGIVIISLGR